MSTNQPPTLTKEMTYIWLFGYGLLILLLYWMLGFVTAIFFIGAAFGSEEFYTI